MIILMKGRLTCGNEDPPQLGCEGLKDEPGVARARLGPRHDDTQACIIIIILILILILMIISASSAPLVAVSVGWTARTSWAG